MSSLAASRADNFYYPPDWRPELGSISKFQGSKGANQYEQKGIIRFELPFDGWCMGCNRHLSRGTRFNAKKEKGDKYFSTQIYSFHMKCPSCVQKFVITTNPREATYDFTSGIRKMMQDYIPEDESLIIATTSHNDGIVGPKTVNAIDKLQTEIEQKHKLSTIKERLDNLIDVQDIYHKNDYDLNSSLRKLNRKRKQHDLELLNEGKSKGLSIPLVEKSLVDNIKAKLIKYDSKINQHKKNEVIKRVSIMNESIFDKSNNKKFSNSKSEVSNPNANLKPMVKLLQSGIDSNNFNFNNKNSADTNSNINPHILKSKLLK